MHDKPKTGGGGPTNGVHNPDLPVIGDFGHMTWSKDSIPTAGLCKHHVCNVQGESLGVIKDVVIDARYGVVAYAILLYQDAKTFAIPFDALVFDHDRGLITVDIAVEVLDRTPGMQDEA